MDSLQFYEGPRRKKSLVKRRKRVDPSQCEIHDAENQVGKTAATSKNETDEAQLQSQSEYPKEAGSATLTNNLDIAFSTSADSQTVTHEPALSIPDSSTKTAACNEFLGEEELPACELVSSHAIEGSNRNKQSHDNMEHTAEKSALSLEAKDTASSIPRSGITFSCHEPNHPLLNHQTITSCEACTFKDGQIFALVQILHSFHHG